MKIKKTDKCIVGVCSITDMLTKTYRVDKEGLRVNEAIERKNKFDAGEIIEVTPKEAANILKFGWGIEITENKK